MPRRPEQGVRPAFRQWRARRPFWGGLLLALGGAEILLTEKASLKVVMHIGMQGLAGYLLPVVMLLCGLLALFSPSQRVFYSLIGILTSLGTWITSNLGGFFIGLLLGAVGSCLTFGWLPDQEPRRGRRQRGKDARAAKDVQEETARKGNAQEQSAQEEDTEDTEGAQEAVQL